MAKIESGVPLPEGKGARSQVSMDLEELRIKGKAGDSIMFEGDEKVANRVRAAASKAMGKGGYTARTVDGGIRVWKRNAPGAVVAKTAAKPAVDPLQ